MPIYEYRCDTCQKVYEIQHRMSETRTACEQCGNPIERLISRSAFSFKGGGWYKDLYSSSKGSSGSGDSGGSSSGGSTPSSSSSSSDSGGGGGSSSSAAAGPAK
jgi:putative FmdB family regulatory protein